MPDNRPKASPKVLSLAVSGLGNVLINVAIYHALQYRAEREAALTKMLTVMRDAANLIYASADLTPEETADLDNVMNFFLRQVEDNTTAQIQKMDRGKGQIS